MAGGGEGEWLTNSYTLMLVLMTLYRHVLLLYSNAQA